jgi:hypothetical protein
MSILSNPAAGTVEYETTGAGNINGSSSEQMHNLAEAHSKSRLRLSQIQTRASTAQDANYINVSKPLDEPKVATSTAGNTNGQMTRIDPGATLRRVIARECPWTPRPPRSPSRRC